MAGSPRGCARTCMYYDAGEDFEISRVGWCGRMNGYEPPKLSAQPSCLTQVVCEDCESRFMAYQKDVIEPCDPFYCDEC